MTPRRILRQHSAIVGLFGPRRVYAGGRRPWLLLHLSPPAFLGERETSGGVAEPGRGTPHPASPVRPGGGE